MVGRDGRCAGRLEVKHQGEWRQVGDQSPDWTLRNAAVVCKQLYCGSAVSVGISQKFKRSTPLWRINFDCVRSGSALTDCVSSSYSPVHYFAPSVTCSGRPRPRPIWRLTSKALFTQQRFLHKAVNLLLWIDITLVK